MEHGRLVRKDLQARINSRALLDNVEQLKGLCPADVKFCAVVKANAYGHGLAEIVSILKDEDVDFFAVASIFEAEYISPLVERQEIFVLEPVRQNQDKDEILACGREGFHCAITSVEAVEYVSDVLAGSGLVLNLHVNVETGMGRCGIDNDQARAVIERIDSCENLKLAGVYTHYATADEEYLSFAHEQHRVFEEFLAETNLRDRDDVIIHAANSAATIKMPDSHYDMVRCGVAMYGYFSRPQADSPVSLKPVLKLQAPIVQLKAVKKGKSISYGRSFYTKRDTTIAVIPLGYADGYWRCLSNNAQMKIGDQFVPVVGRVCMDQLLVDVTDVPEAALGQLVTIIDDSHESPCGAYRLAELADTICYEILTCVHAHVNRIIC